MKIVNVEDYFVPEAGYQINILSKSLAQFGHEVVIITSTVDSASKRTAGFFEVGNVSEKDSEYERAYGVKIVRLPLKARISSRAVFSSVLFPTIMSEKPDVLFVHGNDTLTGMRCLLNRKKLGCPIVMDSHMLEMASANPLNKYFHWFYKNTFSKIIIKSNITVIRTQDDPYVEKILGIPLSQAPWISYGSDTLLFHPDAEVKQTFREKHGISKDDFVVIYTGRFPTQKYSDLAQFYQAADLSVFAKQCSLSFYDAQACGLPVLSEDNNINVDRCSHENGWNFKSGDLTDFRRKIEDIVNLNKDEYQKFSDNAYRFITEKYNYKDKAREYENVLLKEYRR